MNRLDLDLSRNELRSYFLNWVEERDVHVWFFVMLILKNLKLFHCSTSDPLM